MGSRYTSLFPLVQCYSKCGLCACAGPCTAGYRSVPNLTTKRESKPLENFIAF